MGVRGLTTFIRNNEKKYLKNHKLHNCRVLLDGSSIACNLYIWSNLTSAFGGDYDKYAKFVKEFFKLLQKCQIEPLVVFDGGYEQRKLKTVYQRLRDKYLSARNVQLFSGSVNFPLFLRIVFREVLSELNVPYCQSDFEADDELAALAGLLKCPVISYDSDFYIYDIQYIPFTSVSLRAITLNDTSASKYYLECKIYNVNEFIDSFGGLDKSMLPLLAALLGNDYIKRSVFKEFYRNFKIPQNKSKATQKRIEVVIQWLRNETFDSAVTKILSRMKRHTRERVASQIRKIAKGYVLSTNIVAEYLGVKLDKDSIDDPTKTSVDIDILDVIQQNDSVICEEQEDTDLGNPSFFSEENQSRSVDDESETESDLDIGLKNNHSNSEQDEDVKSEEENDSDNEESEVGFNEDANDTYGIPDWLLESSRKGNVPSCVFDILCLKKYFFPPQVEDYSESPCHHISLKILSAIVGLLVGESDKLVKYWTRRGCRLDWYTVEPILETASIRFPPLDRLPDLTQEQRLCILLEVADLKIDLQMFPEQWQLFVVAVLFWLKNMKSPSPTDIHLHTIIMSLVGIYTVDNQIGVHRKMQTFTKKYRNFINKLAEIKKSKEKQPPKTFDELSPETAFKNVTIADCVKIFDTILPYHHLSAQLKIKPKLFSVTTIHAFAQFQSSLFHLSVLNSVLGFPLQETMINKLYSGTFIYNMFTNLSKRNNIAAYVDTLFQNCHSLLNLYKSLYKTLSDILGDDCLMKKPTKVGRKKKRKTVAEVEEEGNDNLGGSEKPNCFFDENNMFSALSLEE